MRNEHFTIPLLDSTSFLIAYSLLIRFHGSKSQVNEILHHTQKTPDTFGIADAVLYSKSQKFQSRLIRVNVKRLRNIPDVAIPLCQTSCRLS